MSQYNWFSTNEVDWINFESAGFEGAISVRPIMGAENAIQTSVGNTQEQSGISIFPNPNSTRTLNVKFENFENQIKEIMVLDVAGRVILRQDFQSNQVDLRALSSGIYFINFVDDANNIIYKEKLILQQ